MNLRGRWRERGHAGRKVGRQGGTEGERHTNRSHLSAKKIPANHEFTLSGCSTDRECFRCNFLPVDGLAFGNGRTESGHIMLYGSCDRAYLIVIRPCGEFFNYSLIFPRDISDFACACVRFYL